MAPFPLEKAHLVGLILEGPLYGLFVATFGAALYSLRRRHGAKNVKLILTTVLMFLVETSHFTVLAIAAFEAFVEGKDGSPLQYYSNAANSYIDTHGALMHTQSIIADVFLVYRCYIIWNRNWHIVALPAITTLGTAIASYGNVSAVVRAAPGGTMYSPSVKPWMTAYIVSTVCTNLLGTGFIAFRLYNNRRQLGVLEDSGRVAVSANSTLAIAIESTGVYLLIMACILAAYLAGSNSLFILCGILPSIIGLTFTAITLRFSLGLNTFDRDSPDTTPDPRQIITIGGTSRTVGEEINLKLGSNLRHIAVQVDHLVEVDRDSIHSKASEAKLV